MKPPTEAKMFDFAANAESNVFIQWKVTNACTDFHCECGSYAHVCDALFMFQIRCRDCGVVWEVPNTLPLRRAIDQTCPLGVDTANFPDEE